MRHSHSDTTKYNVPQEFIVDHDIRNDYLDIIKSTLIRKKLNSFIDLSIMRSLDMTKNTNKIETLILSIFRGYSNSTIDFDAEEKYFWVAHLKSGSKITQYDIMGNENKADIIFEEKKKGNIDKVFWVPFEDNKSAFGINLSKELVLLRRNYISYNTHGLLGKKTMYCLGEKEKEDHNLVFISEEGAHKFTKDFNFDFGDD